MRSLSASSTTASLVQIRRHGRAAPTAGPAGEPAHAQTHGDMAHRCEPSAPRVVGIRAETSTARSALDEQSAYGVGFDQHYAHARGRPIAWVVVAVIIAGTCVCGISLIVAAPWLFWAGVGIVVVGIVIGRVTHAMRDEMVPLPGASQRERSSGEAQPEISL